MSVLTLIVAGGEGNRLSILGEKRAKPAVPFEHPLIASVPPPSSPPRN